MPAHRGDRRYGGGSRVRGCRGRVDAPAVSQDGSVVDFMFSEAQEAVSDLARQIFEGSRPDPWAELAKANLLGVALPEELGGAGLGFIEICLVLEQQGRCVVPLPLLPTLLCALTINEFGNAQQRAATLPAMI